MNARLRFVVTCAALVLSTGSAQAALKSYHVVGKVLAGASASLASYGVTTGAKVDVTWTVELSTAPFSDDATFGQAVYYGPITAFHIQIGSWSADRIDPPMGGLGTNNVIVDNDFSSGVLDSLNVSTRGDDTNHVLQGGALLNLSLAFTAASGGASSDRSLDQDPSRYPIGTGSALGAGGGVYFTIDAAGGGGGHGTADPTAKCRKAQLTSGAKLCQSELKCLATYAKNSAKPDALLRSVACVTKAKNAFTSSYDKAAAAAAKKGLQCGTTDTAATLSGSLDARIGTVASKVNEVDPEYLPLKSSWLGGAGTACGAGLKAEAANAAKFDAAKLTKARQKATDKLTDTANKAVDKAVKKGISFNAPPDVTGFVESVDTLINDTSSDLNGD